MAQANIVQSREAAKSLHQESAMNTHSEYAALFELPIAERLQLVEDLWDSIAADNAELPLPQWQTDELKARAARYDAGQESLHTWGEVVADARRKTCGN